MKKEAQTLAEIQYKYRYTDKTYDKGYEIRWLSKEEYNIFSEHLRLCGQREISKEAWNQIYDAGTLYCALMIDGKMICRACVEKYSDDAWEIADVRTVREFRNHGFAYQVCLFVLGYINSRQKLATMRTEEENVSMQRVIDKLGFERM